MNNRFFQLLKSSIFTGFLCCTVTVSAFEESGYVRIQDKYREYSCTESETQAEMSSCLHNKLKVFDQMLNEVYVKVKHHCGEDVPPCVEELLSAQRAWIVFRDASCKLESTQSYGGSAYNDYLTSCLIGYTRERTQYLNQLIENP